MHSVHQWSQVIHIYSLFPCRQQDVPAMVAAAQMIVMWSLTDQIGDYFHILIGAHHFFHYLFFDTKSSCPIFTVLRGWGT